MFVNTCSITFIVKSKYEKWNVQETNNCLRDWRFVKKKKLINKMTLDIFYNTQGQNPSSVLASSCLTSYKHHIWRSKFTFREIDERDQLRLNVLTRNSFKINKTILEFSANSHELVVFRTEILERKYFQYHSLEQIAMLFSL